MEFLTYEQLNAETIKKVSKPHEEEAIITRDGKYYPVKLTHDKTALDMLKEGIDIKGSIRIAHLVIKPSFLLSSLEGYSELKGVEKDKAIVLTDEQAKVIFKFYMIFKDMYEHVEPFDIILRNSDNLGWRPYAKIIPDVDYYKTYVAKRNIENFQDQMKEHGLVEDMVKLDLFLDDVKETNLMNTIYITTHTVEEIIAEQTKREVKDVTKILDNNPLTILDSENDLDI